MRQLLVVLYLTVAFSAAAAERVEAPKVLKLYLGGSIWGPTYSVEMRDGVLHYEERDKGKETKATVVPTPEQWGAFRKALDSCDVWSWRRTNNHKTDQDHWTVLIAYRAAKVDRSGYGKFPGRTPSSYGSTVEFDNFRKAVSALVGGRKF